MAVERIIGVDFGTSTSVIRIKRYENGNPIGEKLETKEVVFGGNGAMVPTLIMKKDDDPSVCYYGYEAQQKKKKYTNFHSFKMDLESDDPTLRARARLLTEEFYGYLAKQYKSQSDGGHLGNSDDKERTIISYPVKWSEETKRFMLETAKKVGFPNVTGMDEAQAAIQAVTVMSTDHMQKHGLLKNGVGTNILLIDMGAGTTDLVLARYVPGEKPKTEVLNTWPKSGDIQFGGREIDNLLQNFFRDMLDEDDAEMVFRRIGSDKFKSWKEETVSPALGKKDTVSDFEVLDSCVEMMGVELEEYCLDRTALENCLEAYLKQFPELINGCLQDAGMSGSDVDLVIVTGGHSQWYFVNEMLGGSLPRFGTLDLSKIRENPARIIPITRPQETVALGLAYSGIHFDLSDGPAVEDQTRKSVVEQLGHTLNAVKAQKQEQLRKEAEAVEADRGNRLADKSGNSVAHKPIPPASGNQLSGSNVRVQDLVAPREVVRPAQNLSSDAATYTIPAGKSINGACQAATAFFKARKMETQYFQKDNCYIVQARNQTSGWKKLAGMDKAVEIRIIQIGENQVSVKIGGAKWVDKAAGMILSSMIIGPLMPIGLITYGANAYIQQKLITDATAAVERYFSV